MRYAIHPSETPVISLPRELTAVLGDIPEAEVEPVNGGLLIRRTSSHSEQERGQALLDAIASYRASLRPEVAFTDEELSQLRNATRDAGRQEAEEVLGGFQNAEDLPA